MEEEKLWIFVTSNHEEMMKMIKMMKHYAKKGKVKDYDIGKTYFLGNNEVTAFSYISSGEVNSKIVKKMNGNQLF